jgi:ribose transport system permease protein
VTPLLDRINLSGAGRTVMAFIIVVLFWVFASLIVKGFGSLGHFRYLMELSAVIGLVAVGQTLAVISGGIDLSVSAVFTVSTLMYSLLSVSGDTSGIGALVLTVLMAGIIGAVNGLGIGYAGVPPLIMTLAMASTLQGLLVIIVGGTNVEATKPALHWLGSARVAGIPAGIFLWAIPALGSIYWLNATRSGATIYALGTNPLASQLSGVPTRRVALFIYIASGMCAGLAGLLLLAMNGSGYVGIGDPYLLSSIAAVVLGGTPILGGRGSYVGTIAGSFLLVSMTALITMVNVSAGWRSIILGGLILGMLPLSGRDEKR